MTNAVASTEPPIIYASQSPIAISGPAKPAPIPMGNSTKACMMPWVVPRPRSLSRTCYTSPSAGVEVEEPPGAERAQLRPDPDAQAGRPARGHRAHHAGQREVCGHSTARVVRSRAHPDGRDARLSRRGTGRVHRRLDARRRAGHAAHKLAAGRGAAVQLRDPRHRYGWRSSTAHQCEVEFRRKRLKGSRVRPDCALRRLYRSRCRRPRQDGVITGRAGLPAWLLADAPSAPRGRASSPQPAEWGPDTYAP